MHTNLLIFHIISKLGLQVYEINKNNMFFFAQSSSKDQKCLFISKIFTATELQNLISLISEYIDVFAWPFKDMSDLDSCIA